MYTKQDLMAQLQALGIDRHATLMIHLSYKAIGEVDERAEAVLDVFMEYMRPGLLVLPSHTWNNVTAKNPVMDVLYTPSCVGIVPELFRLRPGVCRALHPTHSLAAAGRDAADFVAGEERMNTPCGKGGSYYRLWERDADILLIGVNSNNSTFIHGIEEWDGAEGSIAAEPTNMYVINHEGRRLHTPQYVHSAPLGSQTFVKLEAPAIAEGIMTLGRFGNATTRLTRAQPLRAMAAALLAADRRYLYRH